MNRIEPSFKRQSIEDLIFISSTPILFLVAIVALVVMSQGADVVTLPAWRTCSNDMSKTQTACNAAGGNWDGGSCDMGQIGMYNAFLSRCSALSGQYRCWH
ncbi:hypothetical protein BG006_000967 [Podila minutissima]|uniref:Uncharacterized protein n=1 Tax=Podila minutissima TaxID=64525 RepID=A0A9P5SDJ7_9FUNG|nr:hypothetical protein BG006_000967 [Podila minutissima]